ncbi:MAG: non-canonical purine NTP pyrophosphatase [Firmicutes bacterium HGW-Firmicutes-21]|nr:MAG: non-canonical purine NTP pyrophosphatase [Firmicutes bacterium HGW-Firmicutes-21]
MMKIVFATNNAHKVTELTDFFKKHYTGCIEIMSLSQVGFTDEIIENADSFEGNAFIKASAVCRATGLVAIADDSGLEVDYLGGEPGVYSARYAGVSCSDSDNIQKLLGKLEGVPYEKRSARFVSVICACFPSGKTLSARGVCEGIILTEKRGDGTFGYDPVFYYPPLKRSFAELELDAKNKVSHRGNALRQFVSVFDLSDG